MPPGQAQPFQTDYESVAKALAMQVAQLTFDLALANDQIAQAAADRNAPSVPAAENA